MNLSITGTTTVVGVIGDPVVHSLSPLMHNAAFAAEHLDWVYVPFHVPSDTLAAALAGAAALGVKGLNVTIPHKQAVIPHVVHLTETAQAVGSINTLQWTTEGWLGHSTDGAGFLRALLERGFQPTGARVVLLGAGGAARAVVGALAGAGVAEITVLARHPERAATLAPLASRLAHASVAVRVVPWQQMAQAEVANAQLLVNATAIGMAPHDIASMPLPADWLHAGLWVYDLVYTPRQTALLRAAATRGCHTVDGVAMLVYQGAEAFTLWTRHAAPIAVMETAVTQHLRSQTDNMNLPVSERQ